MSKDRKKVVHIHSNVNDKQPTPSTLELGELGVNNAAGNAFISTKNSNNEVVRFSEDGTIVNWMEYKEVIPYEAYVRGSNTAATDVTTDDLANNKSNIVIKLNQVVARNTEYDEKVNGAKDIYGNEINPISADGYKDGAGLAIDMSRYAMIGANPSFSSITTTCHATLNGTTEIKGKGDGCGSKFTVEVANACIDAIDTLNEYGVNHSNFGTSCDGTKISNDTTLKGKKIFIDSPSGDLTVDIQACNHISGRTNDFVIRECQDNGGKVEIDTTDIDVSASTTDVKSCDRISAITDNFIVEQCNSGKTHIHSCAEITLESKNITLTDGDCGSGQTTIEVNDICLVGERKINVYGDETNVGLDCDDSKIATNTRVFGKGTLITTNATPSTYAGENNIETVAAQDIKENADRDINETAGRNINEAATDNINESAKNINNTASNDICNTATNNATFYGAVKTNVGINCDDTVTAATTTVKGGKVIVDASTTDLGLTAKQDILESSERDIIITANDDICETAGDEATFYGVNLTRLGITCDGAAKAAQTEIGGDDITVYADDVLCESGKTVTVFAGEGGKLTIGGNSCDGNTNGTYPITYVRRPKTGTCDVHATTVDDALDEVLDRSKLHYSKTEGSHSTAYVIWQDSGACENKIEFSTKETVVSMSSTTEPSGSEILKTYTLWQTIGETVVPIGDINIPKDHLLKDVSLVWGKVYDSGQGFQPCTGSGDQDCHWVIKLIWNVFDPESGHPNDKVLYIDVNDLVQDTDVQSTDGVTMKRWYDGKKNMISADTTVQVVTPDGTVTFTKANGLHSINAYKIAVNKGDVKSELSNIEFNPFNSNKSVTIPTDAKHIWRKTLKVNYGAVCNKTDGSETYDPGDGIVNEDREGIITVPNKLSHLGYNKLNIVYGSVQDKQAQSYDPESLGCTVGTSIITIPSCVSDLNREKISFQYGQTVTGESGTKTYDPGASCSGGTTSIKIPNSVSHLNRGTLAYKHNGFSETFDPSVDTVFISPHSALTISYGQTCGVSSTGISYNTSAEARIVVPKTISDITSGTIEIDECGGECITVNGDICAQNHIINAEKFYATSDERLKENIASITQEDYEKAKLIDLKSFNFKDDESKTKTYGVIAQDLQAVGLDNIIHKDDKGNLNVDYTSFLILRIASLESQLKSMEKQISELMHREK